MKRFVLIALAAVHVSSFAEFYDGNKLLARMQGDPFDKIGALGYVMGVYDSLSGISHCAPNITAGQLFDMVKKHLEENAALRHHSADQHVELILKRHWPCQDRKPSRQAPGRGA